MKNLTKICVGARAAALRCAVLALGLFAALNAQAALESVRLADVLRSSGSGTINLLMGNGNAPIPAAQLEAYRLDHSDATGGTVRNYLSLGIDVNENSKGLENSTAQGITLAEVRLVVTRPSGTKTYTEFRTATRALLAAAGSTTRQRYYTALGEGGSSRITSANSVQAAFDSTLDIFVPDSLADASAAILTVRLLDVNKSFGDPESFYDFSGGFEDLALLNRTDAYFLNVTLAETALFRSSAPAVEPVTGIVSNDTAGTPSSSPASWSYFPSADGWYFVAYEDNFPNPGDYDFNDAVVAYRYRLGLDTLGRVIRVEAESYLVAEGAWFTLDWHLRLPIAATGSATCTRRLPGATTTSVCTAQLQGNVLDALPYPNIDNSGAYFSGAPSWAANTVKLAPAKQGAYASISVRLDAPVVASAIGVPDPWLYVQDTARSIHLASRDPSGFPYAMLLPMGWRNPYENIDMGLAYPRFRSFVETGGTQSADWYLTQDTNQIFNLSDWLWGP